MGLPLVRLVVSFESQIQSDACTLLARSLLFRLCQGTCLSRLLASCILVNCSGVRDRDHRCTETLPQETYFAMDGVNDMFWAKTYNKTFINERCTRKYGRK
jgi:hypothetical protein